MISHQEFARLRLAQFVPHGDITDLTDWEFDERLWVGEAVGFTEWLRLETAPDVLQSLSLSFDDVSANVANRIFRAIDLPLRAGMTREQIKSVLGSPTSERQFVPGRTSYEFRTGTPDAYSVSCTVDSELGLCYLVVMVA